MKLLRSNTTSVAKKNARIHWTSSGTITDLVVYSVPDSETSNWLCEANKKTYYSDIGNCLSNWSDWQLSDVLLKLLGYGFESKDVLWKAMAELSKIREFRERVIDHFYFAIPQDLQDQYKDEQTTGGDTNE